MKNTLITDSVRSIIRDLRLEFAARRADERFDEISTLSFNDGRRMMLTKNMRVSTYLAKIGATFESGANTFALVMNAVTIKWERHAEDRWVTSHSGTDRDTIIRKRIVAKHPWIEPFLARSQRVNGFTVQETLQIARHAHHDIKNDDMRHDVYSLLMDVSWASQISDLHMENWGFRGNDRTMPVIFDFSASQSEVLRTAREDWFHHFGFHREDFTDHDYGSELLDGLQDRWYDLVEGACW